VRPSAFHRVRTATAKLLVAGAVLTQSGGCDLGEVTASVTLSAEELIITLIRSAILNPIDAYVTGAVSDLFSDE